MSRDPTTQANYTQVVSEHLHFDWTIDFERKIIHGSASYVFIAKEDGVKEIILDTSALSIDKVEVEGQVVKYEVGPKHEVMGSALRIPLSVSPKANSQVKATVYYNTTEGCTALQWLDKEQTQGKSFPYLFSQCQPIYARTLVPIQDTPSIKATYSAKVSSVLPALLSAVRVSPPSDGPAHGGKEIGKDVVVYEYDQPVPIPSYLIAIAAGNVVYRPFAPVEGKTWKSGVWAEPELIEASYWEFSQDTVPCERGGNCPFLSIQSVRPPTPSPFFPVWRNGKLLFVLPYSHIARWRSLVGRCRRTRAHSLVVWQWCNTRTRDAFLAQRRMDYLHGTAPTRQTPHACRTRLFLSHWLQGSSRRLEALREPTALSTARH